MIPNKKTPLPKKPAVLVVCMAADMCLQECRSHKKAHKRTKSCAVECLKFNGNTGAICVKVPAPNQTRRML